MVCDASRTIKIAAKWSISLHRVARPIENTCCDVIMSPLFFDALMITDQLNSCEIIGDNKEKPADHTYEMLVRGRPTLSRGVSVGCPRTTSEYLGLPHNRGLFSLY